MRADRRFAIGVDLGQANDFTAVAVVERVPGPLARPVAQLHVRHAERFERGLPYPQQVERIAAGCRAVPFVGTSDLVIDRTGVGRAVYDMFVAARLAPIGVTITAGVDAVRAAPNDWRVPKRDLVGAIQVPLGEERLKIADGLPAGRLLLAELQNFRIRVSLTGHDRYEAGDSAEWREGSHDDLVLAVALACWWAEQPTASNILVVV